MIIATHVQARSVLASLKDTVTLARMEFNSRCMQFNMKDQGEENPTIVNDPKMPWKVESG